MIDILHPARDAGRIAALLAPDSGYRFVDGWDTALPELAKIDRPALAAGTAEAENELTRYLDAARADCSTERASRYVVYPWRRCVVKLPDSEHFWQLRTARNRYLLTPDDQRRWSEALIGITGLSVGAAALSVCALTGARRFHLAERDVLGPTNLNRLHASVCDLGEAKLTLAQRRTLELDPYTDIRAFPEGYSPAGAAELLGAAGAQRLTVLIEEMDDLAMKVDIRRRASELGIPVVMVTDHGDNVLLDVERYDLEPGYPLFHGAAGDIAGLGTRELADPSRRRELVTAIVGTQVTPQTRYSLCQVGDTLPSWPQLGTAVTLAGAIAALAARLIACRQPLASGRYRIDADRVLLGPAGTASGRWNELGELEFRARLGC